MTASILTYNEDDFTKGLEGGFMGDAKRRKLLDVNFGKNSQYFDAKEREKAENTAQKENQRLFEQKEKEFELLLSNLTFKEPSDVLSWLEKNSEMAKDPVFGAMFKPPPYDIGEEDPPGLTVYIPPQLESAFWSLIEKADPAQVKKHAPQGFEIGIW